MPPKKGASSTEGSGRTTFLSTVPSVDQLTPAHALQLAGLSQAAGFSLKSDRSAPSPVASGSGSSKHKRSNGKGREDPIELSDSTDDEGVEGKGKSRERSDGGDAGRPPLPHVCKKATCTNNPNCLAFLGQDKWEDRDKARQAFMKTLELGGNPMDLMREPGTPCGLRLGATCYANALLQTWFHDTAFRNTIYDLTRPDNVDHEAFRRTAIYQLQTVFHGLEASRQSYLDPKMLIETLNIESDLQQDAQEFSKLFLELISQAVQNHPDGSNRKVVEEQFEGSSQYVTQCKRCAYKSISSSHFTELDLTLGDMGGRTVDALLGDLIGKEVLSGDNKYACPKCKSHQDAIRYMELTGLPPTLNLSLLRFVYDPEEGERVKSKTTVKYPPSIDMAAFLGVPLDEEMIYDLRAVLVHKGETAYSGHYCAQVHNEIDQNWYECDDEGVTRMSKPLGPPVLASPSGGAASSSSRPSPTHRPSSSSPSTSHRSSTAGPSTKPPSGSKPLPTTEELLNAKFGSSPTKNRRASDLPPIPKKAKSNVPPWETQRTPSVKSVDGIPDSDDEFLEFKARPTENQPSFQAVVPEHTPRNKRRPSNASSAMISHPAAGLSQRTYSKHQKSHSPVKQSSPHKQDYHSTRDAYMLVYRLRKQEEVIPFEAPVHVREEIEVLNLQWETACAMWDVKQTAVAAAFEETLAQKTAIFESWEVGDFDEPAYLLSSEDLSSWVAVGLNEKPKKGGKGSTSKGESTFCANGPTEEPTAVGEPVVADESVPIEGVEPIPPPSLADGPPQPRPDESAVKGVPKASQPVLEEELTPEQLHERTTEKVQAAVLRRPFSSEGLLCKHGKIDPSSQRNLTYKRVSSFAVERLVQLGCDIDVDCLAISEDTICLDCTREYFTDRVLRRRHAEHQASLKSLNQNVSMEDDDPGFWISKGWWRRFFEAVPPGALTDFVVPVPSSDEFQSDVVCVHGGLQPTGSRRMITEEAFDFLKTFYGKFGLFDGGTPKCNICEEDAIPSKMKAAQERLALPHLLKRKKLLADLLKDRTLPLGQLAVVDWDFYKMWLLWALNPADNDRPAFIDTAQFVCQHDLLDFDLTRYREPDDKRFTLVSMDEWKTLTTLYEHGPLIVVEQGEEDTLCKLKWDWTASIDSCEECRRNRRRSFAKGWIPISVTTNLHNLHQMLPSLEASAEVHLRGQKPEKRSAGYRQSKRKRGASESDDPSLYDLEIGPEETVKDLKVAIVDLLKTSVLYITLYFDHRVLEDASATVKDLGIVPGDHLLVYQQPDVDEDEQEQLVLSGGNTKTPRRSLYESGSGFGGTALSSSIYQTVDNNVDSFVKMITPPDHQPDGRWSSPPKIPRLQLKPKKGPIDMSDDDLPSEMIPRISKKRAARTAKEIQQALEDGKDVTEEEMDILLGRQDEPKVPNTCPKCTLDNEPNVSKCVMCGNRAIYPDPANDQIRVLSLDNFF